MKLFSSSVRLYRASACAVWAVGGERSKESQSAEGHASRARARAGHSSYSRQRHAQALAKDKPPLLYVYSINTCNVH